LGGGFSGIRSHLVKRFGENRCFLRFRGIVLHNFHIIIMFAVSFFSGGGANLRLFVKPMNTGEFAFRDQFRFGGKPMLHFVAL
jgi:hypothetical protein